MNEMEKLEERIEHILFVHQVSDVTIKEVKKEFVALKKACVIVPRKKLENWQPPNKEPLTDQTILLLKDLLLGVETK